MVEYASEHPVWHGTPYGHAARNLAALYQAGQNFSHTMEVLKIITELSDRGVKIVFIRQPELSTTGPHGKLLLAIYGYFAETAQDLVSNRTKHGLAAAEANMG